MRAGIIQNINKRLLPFAARYREILLINKIATDVLDISDPELFDKIRKLDLLIYIIPYKHTEKKWGKSLIYLVEKEIGIKCIPSYQEVWHYDEKILQAWMFRSGSLPTVPSYIFFDKKSADKWLNSASYPLIVKLSSGAGSWDVRLLRTYQDAISYTRKIFTIGFRQASHYIPRSGDQWWGRLSYDLQTTLKSVYRRINGMESNYYHETQLGYALFQDYLPGNNFDTRVNIIGDKALAFRRMNRPGDFRASGSGMIDYSPESIDKECIRVAFKVSEQLGFTNMAYDFIYDKNKLPNICEMTYLYSDTAVYECPGYWDKNMLWHQGHFLPQYLHLQYLLNNPELKQT